ncbi:MAG: Na-translocating system protein MpsB, partial [Planctomycetota bacterium]|nr:Na-translocating system protein MpsB [Planctomycetota bacterium]
RYQAFDGAGHAALCPVIVTPKFEVNEVPRSGEGEPLQTYASGSRWNQLGHHLFHDLKRNPVSSLMLIDVLGLFFSVRLIGKTFFQRSYESIIGFARGWFTRPVATQIPVDLVVDDQCESAAALPHGFTPIEQATFVEKGLRAFGLTANFGRFVVLCGHGSTSDNNPYFAAYNCGACGGGHGDANARVFAAMGNQPQVRRTLQENGLDIPDDTWFLAGKHNTATDRVTFYDVEDIPASHAEDLRLLSEDLEEAGRHQALERCHRIPRAPRDVSPEAAAVHMVSRTVDWANVRPEWGLSSNAAFILGRRSLTKDLDLGGRVFLHSYDPNADTDGAILEALMNAPLVVAQWISMEYYFSAVDPTVYGSGSKVTHNVVSGVGVMHGSHGDLQSGLPLQSVNDGARHYHEPMRLLAIIEAPMNRISTVIQKHTLLQYFFHNQWVSLVAVDPATHAFHHYNTDATWTPILYPSRTA